MSLLFDIRRYWYIAEQFQDGFFNDMLLCGYFNNTSSVVIQTPMSDSAIKLSSLYFSEILEAYNAFISFSTGTYYFSLSKRIYFHILLTLSKFAIIVVTCNHTKHF